VSWIWTGYRIAAPVLGALAPAARWVASPAERALWHERLGHAAVAGGAHGWIHAASLGESLAAGPLVRELRRLQPEARLHLTAVTRGGRDRLVRLPASVSLAPIDAPQAVRRFFDGVRPERVFLLETELWPHWLIGARRRRLPVAVVSARLSARSVSRYRRLGARFRHLIGDLAAVLCQSDEDVSRWRAIGARADRTAVVGNLKDDALPTPVPDRGAARTALGLDPDRPLLVLGSVRPHEVRPLARAWQSLAAELRARWQVVAVPRHPHASLELQREAQEAGQPLVSEGAPRDGTWRWSDGLGVLRECYDAAEVAFVGGSLAPYGGHNPLEPAACGAAVIIGPHHSSQADGMSALLAREAVAVAGSEVQLAAAFQAVMENAEVRGRRAAAGLAVAAERRGAAARAVARLAEWKLWPVA
jgi:3-deoxy-D-manno-octulosonic-acid transferase